ncbi:carnosine N-methyltransferase [Cocos nucifera]|uniref:carnosine N-methyltransferase n=1 Tax=Cocos nucifera TaxID=13894 RepID=A0A8K0ID32_COCNU|nr:carnosine N-methyltransferase [Cocos nucifera]
MGERRYSKLEEALEIKSLRRIINSYLNYPDAAEADVRRYERSFKKLSPAHKALLSHLPSKFRRLRWCISVNTHFIMSMLQAFEPPFDMSQDIDIDEHGNLKHVSEDHIHTEVSSNSQERDICAGQPVSAAGSIVSGLKSSNFCRGNDVTHSSQKSSNEKKEIHPENLCNSVADKSFTSEHHTESCSSGDDMKVNGDLASCCHDSTDNGNASSPRDLMDPSLGLNVPLVDVDKVRCIIRNIVRDWAAEGQKERDQCYMPILAELNRLFPDRSKERPPCCLVPGAGLGRLALEISCLGFISQGNEFSYYMMICSNFILNHTQVVNEWTIYPWIHSNCNSLSDNDQLRPVSFPDIHPASAGITEGFSMCGGDFVEVYNDESQEAFWDAVVTCFFLDTAHNIVEYIEIISKLLKSGGVWINLGPLLYHFADSYSPDDEMSIELSLEDVKKVAFHYGFEMEIEKIIETTYTANPRSMMQNRYFAAFWTMKKKPVT